MGAGRIAVGFLGLGFGLLLAGRLLETTIGDIGWLSASLLSWAGWIAWIIAGAFILAIAFEVTADGATGKQRRR